MTFFENIFVTGEKIKPLDVVPNFHVDEKCYTKAILWKKVSKKAFVLNIHESSGAL